MNSKPHRTNSNFQLRHFLTGSCHTADGAYALMYGQLIDMEQKVAFSEASALKRKATLMEKQAILKDKKSTEIEKLKAEADLMELEATRKTWEMNTQAAKDELEEIRKIMAEIEPHRKYGHLPLLEAHEAAQREEWLGELKMRCEDFLLTTGTIPHDHLNTMRCHPDFREEIVPHIQLINHQMATTGKGFALLDGKTAPHLQLEAPKTEPVKDPEAPVVEAKINKKRKTKG